VLSDAEGRLWDNNGQADFHSAVGGALHDAALESHLAKLLGVRFWFISNLFCTEMASAAVEALAARDLNDQCGEGWTTCTRVSTAMFAKRVATCRAVCLYQGAEEDEEQAAERAGKAAYDRVLAKVWLNHLLVVRS
jgi:hypothetical protein